MSHKKINNEKSSNNILDINLNVETNDNWEEDKEIANIAYSDEKEIKTYSSTDQWYDDKRYLVSEEGEGWGELDQTDDFDYFTEDASFNEYYSVTDNIYNRGSNLNAGGNTQSIGSKITPYNFGFDNDNYSKKIPTTNSELQNTEKILATVVCDLEKSKNNVIKKNKELLKLKADMEKLRSIMSEQKDSNTYDIYLHNSATNSKILYDGKGKITLTDVSPRILPMTKSGKKYTCDYKIPESARVSYNMADSNTINVKKFNTTTKKNNNLLSYLMENKHTSPSEMVVFWFKITAPIYVIRQVVRHRTASINEESARYTKLTGGFHTSPLRVNDKLNKQGSREIEDKDKESHKNNIALHKKNIELCDQILSNYNSLYDAGAAGEVIRATLPMGMMSTFVWKMDLHNLLHFIKLRSDIHAQKEIRELSDAMLEIITPYVPASIDAFENFVRQSVTFSRDELKLISGSFNIDNAVKQLENDDEFKKLSKRKQTVLLEKLQKMKLKS